MTCGAVAGSGSVAAETTAEALATVPAASPFFAVPAPAGRASDPIEAAVTRLEFDPGAYKVLSRIRRPVIERFPLAADLAVTLELERYSVTDSQTRFVIGTADGDVDVAAPDVVLFRGKVAGYPDSYVYLGLSPHGSNGMISFAGQEYVLAAGSRAGARAEQLHVVYERSAVPWEAGEPWRCFTDQVEGMVPIDVDPLAAPRSSRRACTIKLIDVAIETDYEYRTLFVSSAAAEAYAVELLGAVSSIYERDVQTALYLPFIRVWDSNVDPYPAGSSPAQRLNQFRSHWYYNMSSVSRDVAQMLSTAPGGGIAYISVLCSNSLGYSVAGDLNGFFPNPIISPHGSNWDLVVSSHELGHNFSSPHTHCYNPPIDKCYNGEGGCWNGTIACQQGTIMSYCHLCGAGMWNIRIEFHQRVVDRIRPYIENRYCVGCAGVQVVDESPDRGSTVGALPEVAVTFNQPVSGVTPDDLTVNGSAATAVSGANEGPYTFTGYAVPAFGTVNVVMAPGSIVSVETGDPFEGDNWTYELVDDCNGNSIPDTEEVPQMLFFNLGDEMGVLDTVAPVAQDAHMSGVGDALLSGFTVYYRSTGSSPGIMTVRFWENDLLDGTLPGAPLGLLAEYTVGQLSVTPPFGSFGVASVDISPYVTVRHNLWVEVEISQQAGVILRGGPTDAGSTHGLIYDRTAGGLLPGGPQLMGLRIGGVLCPSDCNGNGIDDATETDSDGDNLIDACDGCPADASKLQPGYCGCGQPETDTDGDQAPDCVDDCPNNPDVQVAVAEELSALNCEDGVDNDCDGLTDAADPDCVVACICGDVDGSGGPVDLNDFAVFSNCFGLTSPSGSCTQQQLDCCDVNGDGVVDLNDFSTFATIFGQTSTSSPPNCVG
jgi:hypothetical protein